ncbi:hypothetical protein KY284_019265 [Solanum tuberosum]|nr:hypothetical protein KY284_019265 [Solanum tuberosum]
MEKLREGIVKMSNSDPNEPLSETQNSILQQHLDRFMSSLRTNPDLPPYAWRCNLRSLWPGLEKMLEKALQELDEEMGFQ